MIEAKETLIGHISAKQSLAGKLNNAIQYIEPTTQEKTITPTKEEQVVIPDDNIFALSKVTIEKIPDEYIVPNGDIEINSNGTYDVTNYKNVNVEVGGDDILKIVWTECCKPFTSPWGLFPSKIYLQNIDCISNYGLANNGANNGQYIKVTELTFSDKITYIGGSAFNYWGELTTVKGLPVTPPKANSTIFRNCTKLARIEVPKESLEAYKTATNWTTYASLMIGV